MKNRFDIYLSEAGIAKDQFDPTDPDHMESYLQWNSVQHAPNWDVRLQRSISACHGQAIELALECLESMAKAPLARLPKRFLERIRTVLDEHEARRASNRPGMPAAYVWVMDYVCGALLGWPLEEPLNEKLDPIVLEPWTAATRGLVFQRVDDACTRCRKALGRWVIDFKTERDGLEWTLIADRITERLIRRHLWVAWANEVAGTMDIERLRGNARTRYLTRMMQHSVRTWIAEELVNKRYPEGPTLSLFNHIDRAVQGFCTKYIQKYRRKFFRHQFKANGLPTGMLYPALGLTVGQVCRWKCSACEQWKSDRCDRGDCAFAQAGPMDLDRGRLLLRFDPPFTPRDPGSLWRFAPRDVWRCNNPACVGHGYYFFANKCRSKCTRKTEHDCCPLCGQPHAMGGAPWFVPADFTKPWQLARKLCGAELESDNKVSLYIWKQCAPVEQQRVRNFTAKPDDSNADELRRVLSEVFNRLIEGPCNELYDRERIEALPAAAKRLLEQHALAPGRLLRLNRMLLEAAYPMEIANRSQGRAVRTISAYELRTRDQKPPGSGGPQETLAPPTAGTGGGAGAQPGEAAESNVPADPETFGTEEETGSGGSEISPVEAVEKAVEMVWDLYQHYPAWVRETITALAHSEDGKFIWLRALLPEQRVDWAALHGHIKEGLAVKGIAWQMTPEAFEREFKTCYQEPLLCTFDFQLDLLGYALEDLAMLK